MMEDRLGCCVTGVELNLLAAEDAKSNISRGIIGNIQELNIQDKYDAVVATELFEHLEILPNCIKALVKVIEEGAATAGPRFYLDKD